MSKKVLPEDHSRLGAPIRKPHRVLQVAVLLEVLAEKTSTEIKEVIDFCKKPLSRLEKWKVL